MLFGGDENHSYTSAISPSCSIEILFPGREDINVEHFFPWEIII